MSNRLRHAYNRARRHGDFDGFVYGGYIGDAEMDEITKRLDDDASEDEINDEWLGEEER